jgi:hypothetical protein
VREEELVRQFGEVLMQIRIPHELAGKLAMVLRESQADKEKFVRASMLLLRSKLDRVYEDRLSDAISDELWTTHSPQFLLQLACPPRCTPSPRVTPPARPGADTAGRRWPSGPLRASW